MGGEGEQEGLRRECEGLGRECAGLGGKCRAVIAANMDLMHHNGGLLEKAHLPPARTHARMHARALARTHRP